MGVFQPDEAAIAGLVHEDFVRADLHERADRVVQVAQATAPVDTGRYRSSIHKEDGPDGSVLIASNVDYAVYLEFGTRRMRAFRTLGSALDAAGD
jgi:hypothetical protein